MKDFTQGGGYGYSSKKSSGIRQKRFDYVGFLLRVSGAFNVMLLILAVILAVRISRLNNDLATLKEDLKTAQLQTGEPVSPSQGNNAQLGQAGQNVTAIPQMTSTPAPTPSPSPSPTPLKYVVAVDAGHGGNDNGTSTKDGKRLEKNDTLTFAYMVKQALEELDIEVMMTRTEDVRVENADRADMANEADADFFLSLHRNAYEADANVWGVEAWILSTDPEPDHKAAEMLIDALAVVGINRNRGVKLGTQDAEDEYAINRRSQMPSVLLELGFITNDDDNWKYDNYGAEYADASASAVYSWLRLYSDKTVQ